MLYSLVTTLPNHESAEVIARLLLEGRLVACAHVHAPQRSLYYWQGALCDETEVSVSAITHTSLLAKASAAMRAHHPYAVPCIISSPITSHLADYDAWVCEVLSLNGC